MKKSEIIFGAVRVPVDYFAALAAFFVAYYLRPLTDLIPGIQFDFGPELLPPFREYTLFALAASLFLIVLLAVNHLYILRVSQSFGRMFLKIVFLVTVWLMFIISWYFLVVHQLFFSRIALAHIWLFAILFIVLGRSLIYGIQRLLLRFDIGRRRLLFIGANSIADHFYNAIKKDRMYQIIGALDHQRISRKQGNVPIIGTLEHLKEIVHKYHIEEIVQTDPEMNDEETRNLHSFCRNHQIKYHYIPDIIRLQRMNVDVQMIDSIPLVSLKETPLEGWGQVYKRIFDIVVSLFLIIILIPFWAILYALIRLDSKGPAFYVSKRKYRNKIFNVYKFRSMIFNAEALKKDLMEMNERTGPMFKIKNDPRITRIGAFLRKTSLDELPQLFNVLLGNMSLVGPRPHLPEEIDQYESHHYQVFAIKPGMTGLAQISGRSNLDFEEEIRLDIYYIENWSLWLDFKIILKTALVIFHADGS